MRFFLQHKSQARVSMSLALVSAACLRAEPLRIYILRTEMGPNKFIKCVRFTRPTASELRSFAAVYE